MPPPPAATPTPEHAAWFLRAAAVTTPVTTYEEAGGSGRPVRRGTGFFLKHGDRDFVVTNTHILERYAARRLDGQHVRIQVCLAQAPQGIEVHHQYLLTPNDVETWELGVPSRFAHRDVGLIEMKHGTLADPCHYIDSNSLDLYLPAVGTEVYLKGYPARSHRFDEHARTAQFGSWFNVRRVVDTNGLLIITENIAWYRGEDFPEEDSGDMSGVSGSALFSAATGGVVGVVWGVEDYPVDAACYAVPSTVILGVAGQFPRTPDQPS
jgi:hypothetical protein